MSDIFQEVEEGVRQDRFMRLWRRFGFLAWGGALAILVAVAANEYFSAQSTTVRQSRMEALESALAALEAGDYATAQTGFAALAREDTPLSAMAAHYLAKARLEGGGDAAGAAEALRAAAGDGGPLQTLAALKAAYLQADRLTLEALEAELAPLLGRDGPEAALARELLAAKAYAAGDAARARSEYALLRFSPNATQGVIQRAEAALAAIPAPAPAADPEPAEEATP